MKHYDRYLIKKLTAAFLAGLAIYSILFLIQNLFVLSEVIVEKQAPMHLAVLFVSMFFPKIIGMTFPFAVLFAALFVGTGAAANSELVAFTATGISPARQLRPYWIFSLFIFIIYAMLLFELVPVSKIERDKVFNEITRQSLTGAFHPGEFSKIGDGSYILAEKRNSDGSLDNVTLFSRLDSKKLSDNKLYSIELASRASFQNSSNKETSKTLFLEMNQGTAYVFGTNDKKISMLSYGRKSISLNIEGFVSAPDSSSMNFINRLSFMKFISKLNSGSKKAWIILAKRLLLLLFVFLSPTLAFSMSFNLSRGNEGTSGSFVMSFGIAFFFLILTKIFEAVSSRSFILFPFFVFIISFTIIMIVYKHYLKLTRISPTGAMGSKSLWNRLIKLTNTLSNKMKVTTRMMDFANNGTLSGYIRLQFLRIFFSIWIAMEGIYILSIALVNLPKYMEMHVNISVVFYYLLTSLPPTLPYVLPFSFVIAALFHFAWMDSKSELVALKSLGISVYRASVPLFRIALVISILMVFVNTYLAPVFLEKSRNTRPQAIARSRKSAAGIGRNTDMNNIIRSSKEPGIAYYYENFTKSQNYPVILDNFVAFKSVVFSGRQRLQWAYIAKRLQIGPKTKGVIANGSQIFNFNGHNANLDRENPNPGDFIPDSARFFSLHRPETDEMTSYQLRQYISDQKKIGIQPYKYITIYYERFASAFSPLILLLVGLPFIFMGAGGRRKTPARGIASGILLVVLYYAFSSLFRSFGSAHYLPPFLAAWMIDFLFLLWGIFLFTEVRT